MAALASNTGSTNQIDPRPSPDVEFKVLGQKCL